MESAEGYVVDDDSDTLTADDSAMSRDRSSNPASGSCDDHTISRGRRLLLQLWFWRRRAIRKEEAHAGTSQVIRRPRPPKPDAKAQCRAAAAFATLSVHGIVSMLEHMTARMVLSADNLKEFGEGSDNDYIYWHKVDKSFVLQGFYGCAKGPGVRCLQRATGEMAKTVASMRALSNVLHGLFDDAVNSRLLGDDSTILLQTIVAPERAGTTTSTITEAARAALQQVQASLGVIRRVPINTTYGLGTYKYWFEEPVQNLIKALETLKPHVQRVHDHSLALHSYHHPSAGSAVTACMQMASAMQEATTCIRIALEALDCVETMRQIIIESMARPGSLRTRHADMLKAEERQIDMVPASEAIKDTTIACDIVQRTVAALDSE